MRFNGLKSFLKRHKRLLILASLLFLISFSTVVALRGYSAWRAQGQIYTLAAVPDHPVALVFGAEIYADGSLSAMLADRVRMSVQLYQAGKVKALLFSGDNHVASYDEPQAMRQYALSLGVPYGAITLDYAGFRTYDSCYRARDIFAVSSAILVSQGFHLDRALLICNQLGIDSVGVAADVLRPAGYSRSALLSSELREFPSTSLSIFDLLVGRQPTFLGDPLPIFAAHHGRFPTDVEG